MSGLLTQLPWHRPYWQVLQQYIMQQRVPQALLITGVAGLGKQRLAEQFASALLCEAKLPDAYACGTCHSCLLQQAATHPDFFLLQPEELGKSIGIDSIRRLLPVLSLKPQFSGFRVVLIAAAEWLNNAAANAFLKCLEEPNERTVIVLVSANPSKLPATIRSRCQTLHMLAPTYAETLTWLQQHAIPAEQQQVIALAQGAPLLALQYAQEQVLVTRQQCFTDWLRVAKSQQNPVSLAARWQQLPGESLLGWLCSWVADLIKSRYTLAVKHFHNPDFVPALQELQKQLDLKAMFAFYDELLLTQKQYHTQVNKQLVFEAILIHWFNLQRRE